MLTFPITLFGCAATATRTFIAITPSAASGTNHTFTGVSLGSPVDTSLVAVIAYVWSTGNDVALSSVPIDGTNGTIHIQAQGKYPVGTRTATAGIISRATTSTSGDITLNCSAANLGAAIAVYRLNQLTSATADDTASAISAASGVPTSPISDTINITANGLLLMGVCVTDVAPSSVTGAAQDGSTTQFPLTNLIGRAWAGSEQAMIAESNRSLSASTPDPNTSSLVAVTWH